MLGTQHHWLGRCPIEGDWELTSAARQSQSEKGEDSRAEESLHHVYLVSRIGQHLTRII